MKLSPSFIFLALLLLLPSCAMQPPVDLLPGVVYYDGPEKLTGKLTFLLENDVRQEKSAAIYEFDLSAKKLRKVTDSPKGLFAPPDQGDVFCVVYGPFEPYGRFYTNAFVYSVLSGQTRILHLSASPRATIIAGRHIFFKWEEPKGGDRLWDYDADLDRFGSGEFSDPGWQKRWEANYSYRAFDGSYIFFEGSGAPSEGLTLVSSKSDVVGTGIEDPKGRNVLVLRKYSLLRALGGSVYLLNQMSPDGRYALVRMDEPTPTKIMEQSGWSRTYYAVDVTNGKERLLLKENVEHTTFGSMSGVWWAGDRR
jgi:hypothetical protein